MIAYSAICNYESNRFSCKAAGDREYRAGTSRTHNPVGKLLPTEIVRICGVPSSGWDDPGRRLQIDMEVNQMRNDRFCKYRGGELNFGSKTWATKCPPRFCRLPMGSSKLIVDPSALGRFSAYEAETISGSSNGLADCKSQERSGVSAQQPMGDRICFAAEGCMCSEPVWQQHCMPQPSAPITPEENKLPARIRTRTVHTAFSRIDLVSVKILFIVI